MLDVTTALFHMRVTAVIGVADAILAGRNLFLGDFVMFSVWLVLAAMMLRVFMKWRTIYAQVKSQSTARIEA